MSEPGKVWDYVRGLEKFSLCDWPGHTSCVIFLGSCNLKCPTCHNFRLAWDMESIPVIPRKEIREFLAMRKTWLDGVTVTGGCPTVVPGVAELLADISKYEMPIKLDTNGMRPDVVSELLDADLVDVFAVDVKGPFDLYPKLTGGCVSTARARENLEHIFALARMAPDRFYFRLTAVPGISEQEIEIARGYLPDGFELRIQKFVPPRRNTDADANNEKRRAVRDLVN